MVSTRELSINIVIFHKLKMLTSLSQTGNVVGTRGSVSLVMGTQRYRWIERT